MRILSLFLISAFVVGCGHMQAPKNFSDVNGEVLGELGLMGKVKFSQVPDGVQMFLDVRGLPKGKTLASHIHENGKCEAPGFTSAGSHFNPAGHKHGQPDSGEHHAGDLGNQETNKSGVLIVTKVYKTISLDPKSTNYIGNRSLIIHAKADDFSQPVGNAGGRLACAVLKSL